MIFNPVLLTSGSTFIQPGIMTEFIFLISLSSSLFLTGLIWMVQFVHYPFFRFAAGEHFTDAMNFHRFQISFIVVPAMLAELFSTAWLAFYAGQFAELHIAALAAVILIWLITFFVMVPVHSKLSNGFDSRKISVLVRTNWARTGLWTLKSGISLIILWRMISL